MRYLGVADDQIELFVQRWEQNIMALCQNASLYEGIYPVMCKLHQAGMLVGINPSRRSNELGDLHAYIREPFLDLCSLIVTCDKVQHPKPAPDSMLYYCQQTGLSPKEVLFVGDSEFDAECAKAAGCDFALATWGCFYPEKIEATYKPSAALDLLSIVGLA